MKLAQKEARRVKTSPLTDQKWEKLTCHRNLCDILVLRQFCAVCLESGIIKQPQNANKKPLLSSKQAETPLTVNQRVAQVLNPTCSSTAGVDWTIHMISAHQSPTVPKQTKSDNFETLFCQHTTTQLFLSNKLEQLVTVVSRSCCLQKHTSRAYCVSETVTQHYRVRARNAFRRLLLAR